MAEPADRKLYLGPKLRVLRRELGLNQTQMAEELGISPSYLNHLERNQRPLTAQMLLRLANTYDIDIRDFTAPAAEGGPRELGEILSDALVRDIGVTRDEVLEVAENYPGVTEAVARFYRALSDLRRVPGATLAGAERPPLVAPVDWLREMIARAGNYFAEIDAGAESIAADLPEDPALSQAALRTRLKDRHGMSVQIVRGDLIAGRLRHYDMHRRRLMLSERLPASGRLFAIAWHLVAQDLADAIAAIVVLAACQYITTKLVQRSRTIANIVKAEPTLLTHKGEYLRDAMLRTRISEEEIKTALRQNGITHNADANWVVLETNGQLSVIPRQDVAWAEAEALSDVHAPKELKG